MFPNKAEANFCAKCGAPLSSYAATGPFESLFAEGHVYRQAAERPRKFIVVLGVWVIFSFMAFAGAFVMAAYDLKIVPLLLGASLVLLSVVVILKTTHNYLTRSKPQRGSSE